MSLMLTASADVQGLCPQRGSPGGAGSPASSASVESPSARARCRRADYGTPSLDLSKIDVAVTNEFAIAWRHSGIGRGEEEGLVLILAAPNGGYRAVEQSRTGEHFQFTFGTTCDVIAIVHTHPTQRPAEPSPRDQQVARQLGVTVATITWSGMYVYDPVEKRTTKVLDRLDWLRADKFREGVPSRPPGPSQPVSTANDRFLPR
jgi:hypothetical protein